MSDADLSKLNHRDRDLAQFAIQCGWRAHQVGNWGVDLHAPGPNLGTISLRRDRNIERSRLPRIYQEVIKKGDQDRVAAALPRLNADQVEIAQTPPEPEAPPTEAPSARTVVRTVPWIVNPGTLSSRESTAILVRHWSDGTQDYLCAKEGCGWSAEKRASVSSHYSKAAGHDHPRAGEKRSAQDGSRGPRAERDIPQPPYVRSAGEEMLHRVREIVSPELLDRLREMEQELDRTRAELADAQAWVDLIPESIKNRPRES